MNTLLKNILLLPFNILFKISPEIDLRALFLFKQRYVLSLKNPKTYNEKLQWIKLYDKNPLMTKCCDKYAVRKYVEEKGCGEILNTLIWSGNKPEDIPWEKLPDKFVIKVTHGSTFNIICTDKNSLDINNVNRKCKKWLKAKFLPCYGEWFYGVEKPRIIIERYLENKKNELHDYKVFCFNGEPRIIRIDTDRFTEHKIDVYNMSWERINNEAMGFVCSNNNYSKPVCLNQMIEYSRKLSEPFLHARVDFYVVDDKPVFGEITFTNGAGFDKFTTYDFDLKMGTMLDLKKGAE